jgi:regulatory protein
MGIYPGTSTQPWLAQAGRRLCALMPKITAIELQKKNPDRVSIHLDEQFAFGLSRLVAAWLKVGQDLSAEKIAALQAEDAREVAIQKALRFLGYRARSVHEVRENLQKHAIPEVVIELTLKRLQETGLLNDQEFAQAWVENRNTFRPRSRRVLSLELRRKGLAEDVIQQTLEQNTGETSLAREAARKYLRKVQGLEWPDFRNRLGGFLGRRGFTYAVVAPVLRELWAELHPNGDTTFFENEE